MKERLAKLNMSLPEAHVPSGTERLATAEELAEIGGTTSDPLTETQILALLEVQMKDDLQKAAEESAAQAKAAALHELEAALNPKPADGAEKSFSLGNSEAGCAAGSCWKVAAKCGGDFERARARGGGVLWRGRRNSGASAGGSAGAGGPCKRKWKRKRRHRRQCNRQCRLKSCLGFQRRAMRKSPRSRWKSRTI